MFQVPSGSIPGTFPKEATIAGWGEGANLAIRPQTASSVMGINWKHSNVQDLRQFMVQLDCDVLGSHCRFF